MKKRTKRLLVLCALLVVAAITVTAIALPTATQENPQGEKSPWFIQPATGAEGYVPPHNPYDTPEAWKSRDTRSNAALIQIPDETLKTMPTVQLVKSCLNYVYIGDMGADNDMYRDHFVAIRGFFNGFGELFSRPDCGAAALTVFQNIDLNELRQIDEYPWMKFETLRTILWQQEIIDSLSVEQKIQMVLLDQNFYNQIIDDPMLYETFGGAGHAKDILAARYLVSFDQEIQAQVESNENLKNFINFLPYDGQILVNAPNNGGEISIDEFVDRKYGEQQ